jgi:hypothetical protein
MNSPIRLDGRHVVVLGRTGFMPGSVIDVDGGGLL